MKSLILCALFLQVQASEIITVDPVLPSGSTANAPISNEHGVKNWVSGGSGCCVMASNVANANYLGYPEWGRRMKEVSLTEVGGHTPEKLERQLQKVKQDFPELEWRQWYNVPDGWERVKQWSASGVPVGITWGTGQHYGMKLIYHMVSCTHADDEYVQVKDNNYPDEYSTVPEPEGRRRWEMGGMPWAVILVAGQSELEILAWVVFGVVVLVLFAVIVIVVICKLRSGE